MRHTQARSTLFNLCLTQLWICQSKNRFRRWGKMRKWVFQNIDPRFNELFTHYAPCACVYASLSIHFVTSEKFYLVLKSFLIDISYYREKKRAKHKHHHQQQNSSMSFESRPLANDFRSFAAIL